MNGCMYIHVSYRLFYRPLGCLVRSSLRVPSLRWVALQPRLQVPSPVFLAFCGVVLHMFLVPLYFLYMGTITVADFSQVEG